MKLRYLTLTVAFFSISIAANAEDASNVPPQKSVDKWTCEEFVAIDEQFKPKAIYWASAHNKSSKKHKSNVLNIEGTEKVIPMVIDQCTQEPKATFWSKLKNAWQQVEAGTKVDVKEIKSDLEDIKTNMTKNRK